MVRFNKVHVRILNQCLSRFRQHANKRIVERVNNQRGHIQLRYYARTGNRMVIIVSVSEATKSGNYILIEITHAMTLSKHAAGIKRKINVRKKFVLAPHTILHRTQEMSFIKAILWRMQCI